MSTSTVHLTENSVPLATARLAEEVFQSHQPAGTGLKFGQGLSPFATVCEGHAKSVTLKDLVKKAAMVEAGTTMSLDDAVALTSGDVRFPTDSNTAMEKLCGWSAVVDVFHGPTHEIAVAARDAVSKIGP